MALRRRHARRHGASSRERPAAAPGPAPGGPAPGTPGLPAGELEPLNVDDPSFHREGRDWLTPAEQQRLQIARQHIHQREFIRAVEQLQPLVQMSPDLAVAHHELAIAHLFAGQPAEALRAARRAATLRPRWDLPRVLLARLYFEAAQYEMASASCRVAIDLGSRHPDLFLILGQASKQLHRLDKALQAFEILVAVQPAGAEAHFQLGLVLRQLGDEQRAQGEFVQALRLDPKFEPARRVLSRGPQPPDLGPLADRSTDLMGAR
jgi:tetratricopeptide (TPR) repeat protein